MTRNRVSLVTLSLTLLMVFNVAAESPLAAPLAGTAAASFAASNPQKGLEGPILEITTVPSIPGASFRLYPPCSLYVPSGESMAELCFSGGLAPPDTLSLVADQDGIARVHIETAGPYILEFVPWADETVGVMPEFSRWGDDVFLPARELMIVGNTQLEAGFDVHRSAELLFVDRDRQPVDVSRIESVVLRSSHGNVHHLEAEEPAFLQSGRVLRRDTGGLEETEIVYTVQSVFVDGSDVVNRGQQRFVFDDNEPWEIELLLYDAQIQARDALLGFGLGDAIDLEYPDGDVERISLESGANVEIHGLARGTYQARVIGVWGYSPPTLFVLSRDQSVQGIVVSLLDVALVFGLAISGALLLLLIGRPKLLGRLRKADPEPGAEPVEPKLD